MSLNPIHPTRLSGEERLNASLRPDNYSLEGKRTAAKTGAVFVVAIAALIGTLLGGPALGIACAFFATVVVLVADDASINIVPSSYFYNYPTYPSYTPWYSRSFSNSSSWNNFWPSFSHSRSGGHVPVGRGHVTPPPSRTVPSSFFSLASFFNPARIQKEEVEPMFP